MSDSLSPHEPEQDPSEMFDLDAVELNSYEAEIVKGTMKGAQCWIHSPAMLQLLALPVRRLLQVAELRGQTVSKVTHVRAARAKNKKIIYVWPVSSEEPEQIEVKAYGGATYINLITLLGPAKLQIPARKKRRFLVVTAKVSPVGPALKIDLGKPLTEQPSSRSSSGKAEKAKQPKKTRPQAEQQPGAEQQK